MVTCYKHLYSTTRKVGVYHLSRALELVTEFYA